MTSARKPFVYVDFTCGAWGGSPWADGLDGNSHMMANMASQSIEVTEAEMPMAVMAYEFVTDKAGAGKLRGGVPFRRDYRFLEHEGMLQVRSDRRDHRPFGLYGGSPGQPSENYLNPDTDGRAAAVQAHDDDPQGRRVPPCARRRRRLGRSARTRSRRRCCATCATSSSRPARAKSDYGVIVDTKTWRVDEAATNEAACRDQPPRAAGARCQRSSGMIRWRLNQAAE